MPHAPLGTIQYTVQPGDTLYRIARYYNTTIRNIQAFNDIPDPNKIYAGQRLVVTASLR